MAIYLDLLLVQSVLDHHILLLEIPMNDTFLMHEVSGAKNLPHDVDELEVVYNILSKLFILSDLAKITHLAELNDHQESFLSLIKVVIHIGNVRVLSTCVLSGYFIVEFPFTVFA
jgi:hypothetical protein